MRIEQNQLANTITMNKPKHLRILCLLALLPVVATAWEKDKPATPRPREDAVRADSGVIGQAVENIGSSGKS